MKKTCPACEPTAADGVSGREVVSAILKRRRPPRFAYGPNYWQWFQHQQDHGKLTPQIADCRSQFDLIERLGLDVFSRNIYSDQKNYWFGGLCETLWDGVTFEERIRFDGSDRITERCYHTSKGTLSERLRFIHRETTLVQEKFLLDDSDKQWDAFAAIVHGRRWRFVAERYREIESHIGSRGVAIAGELHSPLKMLHLSLGAPQTTFLLVDHPERAADVMAAHQAAQLDLVRQMAEAGVPAMMSMDNLDTAFHPPRHVEQCSASFYEQASRICKDRGSAFFIHACGRQRANLRLIASLGVDGLEGVAFPTLGDVELDEAMRLSGERLIITGGISAMEFDRLRGRDEVFAYVRDLLDRMRPYAHRFVLASSCVTPYNAPWESLVAFRDAWREYAEV